MGLATPPPRERDAEITLKSRHWARPWHTLQHAVFVAPSCFDHSMSDVNVNKWVINKLIRVWKVHNRLWDPNNSKYINWPRWSGRYSLSVSCSTDLDNFVVFVDWVGVSSLVLCAQSTTRDYVRAEHKLHTISMLFISQVIIPHVTCFFVLFRFCFWFLFVFSPFISRGLSTLEPASGRVTDFTLRAYTGTMC